MALILDATLNGSNSNSYVTLEESNTYFEARLYTTAWDSADVDTKNKSLVMATRRIDYEKWYGTRTTTTQALTWSRTDVGYLDGVNLNGIIPIQIKQATFELALHMLSNDMSQIGLNNVAVKKIKVGSLEKEYHYDSNDNTASGYDTLPSFVESLLEDISISVSGSGQIEVGR